MRPAPATDSHRALTSRFEQTDVLDTVGEAKLARMARSIVSVRVDVERLAGKAKMSQNRHPDDIRSLADALKQRGEQTMVNVLRDVSLPHAEARFAMINQLRGGNRAPLEVSGTGS